MTVILVAVLFVVLEIRVMRIIAIQDAGLISRILPLLKSLGTLLWVPFFGSVVLLSYEFSKYNVIFANKESAYYLWNTYSGAFIRLREDGMHWLKAFHGENDNSEFFNIMFENGCILENAVAQLRNILDIERRTLENTYASIAHFMIAPGLGCNYHCSYCFEEAWKQSRSTRISQDVMDAIAYKLVDCIEHGATKCMVEWFGGEPLLYFDEIVRLSTRLLEICSSRNVQYRAHLTSNGSLLTKSRMETLVELHVDSVQITIDGTKEFYCHSKGASVKQFDAVIRNLVDACDIVNGVTVRINTDGRNYDEVRRLTDFLLSEVGLEGKVRLWIAPIRNLDGYERPYLLADVEQLVRTIENYCFQKYPKQVFKHQRPVRLKTSCGRLCASSFSIGPKGELYICDEHVGIPEYEIGNIQTGKYSSAQSEIIRSMRRCEHRSECLQCAFFPLCLGGCVNKRLHHKEAFDCQSRRENFVRDFALSRRIEGSVHIIEEGRIKAVQ